MSGNLPPVPGREYTPGPFVDHERIARLEERMGQNGEDLRELKEAQQRQEDSHEGLKKRVADLDTAVGKAVTRLTIEVRWVKWLLVFLGALGVFNGILRLFGR